MKIYTRKGDDGNTSLAGGRRVPKFHPRVEAYGSIDELTSWIGLLRDFRENDSRREILIYIQDQLMRYAIIMANEEDDPMAAGYLPEESCIAVLENEIDKIEEKLPPIKNFVVPGGHVIVSYCNIARCICRRAERAVLRLNSTEEVPDIIYRFLNRLSDYLFVLSRIISLELDIEEITWQV